ncbi:hypothetical protein PIB30_077215 [Stylosanthes scabra]|uniref:Reverse transcriptase domain-containing protein n=1 Tax=Stylosanthes scabra TaxID=79078 RepID=A0ABU6ZP49_9FABA|nr:hypothetical protein [Stylosanthes scabra]
MVNIQEDNERTGKSSPDLNTPLKEMNPSNAQQLETALRELLKRQTREVEIASDTMKKADEGDETGDSRSRTWKPSIVIGKPPAKENSKHPFSLETLSEELPKKFKYPVDMEPYDGTNDPKHHLDVFDNWMRKTSRREAPREDHGRQEQRSGRSYYNPLNVSLTTFLHEASQVERIPAPQTVKDKDKAMGEQPG